MSKEIDYLSLLNQGKGRMNGRVNSPSGRLLETVFNNAEVRIIDTIDNYYLMMATNTGGTLALTLFTTKNGNRHPDMYARKFVKFVLDHFEKTPSPVRCCEGIWLEKQKNYQHFMKVYTLTHDLVNAAKSTWSGKLFTSLGFTEVSASRILLIPADHRREIPSAHVRVLFTKP